MLKPSMFNYTMYNDDGELLMLNTFTARIIKASAKRSGYIQNILNESSIDSEDALVVKLKDEGLLVDQDEDEKIKLQRLFLNIQSYSVLTLMILPTEQCNFRCGYCPESFEKGKMNVSVQKSIVEYVRKNIALYTGLRIMWFGGEPLLEMEIIRNLSLQFKKICKTAKRSYSAHITTNAYLLSYDVFKELLDYNVLQYQITIDGIKETHDIQRPLINGGPTYETILKNLLDIKHHSKSGKFRIDIRTNFTKRMISTIPQYIEWFHSTFEGDKRFVSAVSIAGDYGGESVKDMIDELIIYDEDAKLFFETLINSNIQNNNVTGMLFSPGNFICAAGHKNFYLIGTNGDIRKCSCHLEDNHMNKIGCMLENGFMDIDMYKNTRWSVPIASKKCDTCFLSPVCFGHSCCYINILNGVPKCPKPKKHIDYYLKMADKQGLFGIIE